MVIMILTGQSVFYARFWLFTRRIELTQQGQANCRLPFGVVGRIGHLVEWRHGHPSHPPRLRRRHPGRHRAGPGAAGRAAVLPARRPHRRLPGRGHSLPRPRRAPAPREDPLQGRGPRLPADAVAAAHQPRPVPAPDRGPANLVERRRPRRRRAADRHRQDASSPSSPFTRPAGPPSSSRRPSTCSTSGTANWPWPSTCPSALLGGGNYEFSRSPSPPTIPPTSISNAGATASACWSSTSAITCRGRRTWRPRSAASPRSASA